MHAMVLPLVLQQSAAVVHLSPRFAQPDDCIEQLPFSQYPLQHSKPAVQLAEPPSGPPLDDVCLQGASAQYPNMLAVVKS